MHRKWLIQKTKNMALFWKHERWKPCSWKCKKFIWKQIKNFFAESPCNFYHSIFSKTISYSLFFFSVCWLQNVSLSQISHWWDCRSESVVESNTVKENPRRRAKIYLTKLSRDRAERVLWTRNQVTSVIRAYFPNGENLKSLCNHCVLAYSSVLKVSVNTSIPPFIHSSIIQNNRYTRILTQVMRG